MNSDQSRAPHLYGQVPCSSRSHRKGWSTLLSFVLTLLLSPFAHALGDPRYVTYSPTPGAFPLSHTPILLADNDYPGVRHAATSFSEDLRDVTGSQPELRNAPDGPEAIIVGTLGHSTLIDDLVSRHKLDASRIAGHWESALTIVVEDPAPGIRRALVIAGADKRGTIFALYALSEQIGVSPWHFWADVPTPRHDQLFVTAGQHLQPSPAVQYRGIFLNDEAPSLSGWAYEKFGGFNSKFYVHVFELLLRLRANYLWPAMWGNAFNEDDPDNPRLADEYGIVMGTSHHEPMLRAQQEWKRHGTGPWDYTKNAAVLQDFWRKGIQRNGNYESTITLGMRGDGDEAMTASTNTALLERIVADQRKILAENMTPTIAHEPKVWALYKEVQDYYEAGMRVPDDITLLWCDDNWGNIRRLPTADERKRPGGAGIYYHFDYVGDPVSYKWLNTYSLPKVWEQMNLALQYGADRIWIVNVGDLKPMELPISFFLTMARNPALYDQDHIGTFTQDWATQQFGPEHAAEIAAALAQYTRLNALRKPEMLKPDTFSITNFDEASRVDNTWRALTASVDRIATELPEAYRPAYFELVQYPADASATVAEMYIAAGRNQLLAGRGCSEANQYAAETRRLFAHDAELTDEYNHKLLNGKWDHMMDQTHIGYTGWNQPDKNTMPTVTDVPGQKVCPTVAGTTSTLSWTEAVGRATGPFLETNNSIAIEAAHTASRTADGPTHWQELPGYGQGLSAMTIFPVDSTSKETSKAALNYEITTTHAGPYTLNAVLNPTLNFVPGRGLRFAVSIDNGPRQIVDILTHNTLDDWKKAVGDGVKKVSVPLNISRPGRHTLHLWVVDPGVVLERLVLAQTPLPPSYLGPPESPRAAH